MHVERFIMTMRANGAWGCLPGQRIQLTGGTVRDSNRVRRFVLATIDHNTIECGKVLRPSRGYAKHVRRAKAGATND